MKRLIPIGISLVILLSVLSGCVGGGGEGAIIIPELTGKLEDDIIALGQFFVEQGINEIKYTVWGAGDPNAVLRVYGIVEAANRINKILSDAGIDLTIKVEYYWSDSFQELYDSFLSAVPQGTNGDFFVNSYIYIANLAEEEYILDITNYVQAYSDFINDFYQPLLEAAKYKGKYYGIPQDTEARPLYVRKDVAAAMGWDISDLAEKVKNGEFTWYDVYHYASIAVSQGYSNWGVIHRKGSAHPDLIQFIFAFGGRLYDEETGKLVVDKEAIYKWFKVEYELARAGLLPEDMLSWDWGQQIHPTVVGEKDNPSNTLFYIGGIWQWAEWQTKSYYKDPQTGESRPLTPEEVKEKLYYTLFPAGEPGKQPVTLSQPFMWMIASNAGKDNPKYDELKEAYHKMAFLMIVVASDPEINAIHSVISSHAPVRKSAAQLLSDPNWQQKLMNLEVGLSNEVLNAIKDIIQSTAHPINIEFLSEVSYMLEYTHFAPSYPYYPKLADILKDALDNVLRGAMTPEDAVNYVIQKVNADPDLKDNTIIEGEIPTNWQYP